jgi:replicative DNA helicase
MNKEKIYKNKKKDDADLSVFTFGSITPQARDLENAVIGAIMLESHLPDALMNDFSEDLFYIESNKIICKAIRSLYKDNSPIDILTVAQKLREQGELDLVGGSYNLANLTSMVSSAANVEYHLRILQQQSLKRKVIQVCTNGVKKAFDETEDIFDTYAAIQQDLDLSLKELMHYDVKVVATIHEQLIKESIKVSEHGAKSGIESGLRMLDNVTNGFQKSDLIILAGRPGMGKTACAVSIALYPSVYKKIPTAIFSLEMSSEQVVARMQSYISEQNVSKIIKKQLTKDEVLRLQADCYPLETAPIYIDDTPNISLLELKGKARKLVKENGVKLIVVDYLQLMRSGLNIQNREQEIAEISRGLKGLAKELDIPIMALAQLSRAVEARGDKKPMLSDLRESGSLEQDADMVMFCYRPEYYAIENYEVGGENFDTKGLFMLMIAKHRNGELGEIPLTFIHHQTKVTNHGYGQQNSYIATNYKPINKSNDSDEPPF